MVIPVRENSSLNSKKDGSYDPSMWVASIVFLFYKHAIPSVLAMVITGVYVLVDGLFIGHVLGSAGLAAINISAPIVSFIGGIGATIGVGAGSRLSIARGKGDISQASQLVSNAYSLIIITSLLLIFILIPVYRDLLALFGNHDPFVQEMADEYAYYLIVNALPLLAGTALPFMVRNDNKPNLTMIVLIGGGIINIILDWVLVIMMNYGVVGAAIATVTSEGVVGLVCFLYFFISKTKLKLTLKKNIFFSIDKMISIVKTGIPSFFVFCYYALFVAIHNYYFLKYGGVISVAAFTIVGYIETIYYLVAEGVGTGIQPIVSYNKGIGNYQRINKIIKFAIINTAGFAVIIMLLVNIFPEFIVCLFNSTDAQLVKETVVGLHLHLSVLFLDGVIVLVSIYFQAIDKIKIALFITISNLLITWPFLRVCSQLFSINGVWLAAPLSNLIIGIICCVLLYWNSRQHILRANHS